MYFSNLQPGPCKNPAHALHGGLQPCSCCQAEHLEFIWRAMDRCEWDMETPVAVLGQPVILYTLEEVANYCLAMGGLDADHLPRFVLCEPSTAPYVNPIDALRGWIDPTAPLHPTVRSAFDALNSTLKAAKVNAWHPSRSAIELPEVFLFHLESAGNPVATA